MQDTPGKITALYYRTANKTMFDVNPDYQMRSLLCYANEQSMDNYIIYADNGFKGRTFDRPAFSALRADIGAGRIGQVFVSDASRIGRDSLLVNRFLEWANTQDVKIADIHGETLAPILTKEITDALCQMEFG
jgi:DNA invertase Pin-like site-specific DNA recombinase